jgi:predicted nucleic acid-binding protein
VRVLVDTSAWSLALRRRAPAHPAAHELRRLVTGGRAAIIGPIRQEVLSGIRDAAMFERLRERLSAFPDEALTTGDYEQAAEFFNVCRAKGLQGSNTDFLICAVSVRHRLPVLTTDADFARYGKVVPLVLHPFGA